MRCIPLKQVPSAEHVDSRLRKAVKEMRKRYAFWVPYRGFYESLCISYERIELIFYIDMRQNIMECTDECMVDRRKMHEICIRRGEECWEFDEEAEREFCRSSCDRTERGRTGGAKIEQPHKSSGEPRSVPRESPLPKAFELFPLGISWSYW